MINSECKFGSKTKPWPVKILISGLSFPLAVFLYPACRLFKIKLYRLRSSRIGHLAANTELFLRRKKLGIISQDYRPIGVATTKPCNEQLLKMFKREMPIIQISSRPVIRWLIKQLASSSSFLYKFDLFKTLPFLTNEYFEFCEGTPSLQFTEEEERTGRELLNKMQINGRWFVCFHSRDAYYLNQQWKKGDSHHDFRNCNVENYLPAAEYITERGGFAIRMGVMVNNKLNHPNPKIIDYAQIWRTDFGDIFLPAKCKFFLGNTSGPFLISTIFNIPSACANIIPIKYPNLLEKDLFIPKKIWSLKEKRYLTFPEMILEPSCHFNSMKQYEEAGLVPKENTAEEILDLAVEMNQRLDGTWQTTLEDEELQNKLKFLFPKNSPGYGFRARIGAQFLRQNKDLLGHKI